MILVLFVCLFVCLVGWLVGFSLTNMIFELQDSHARTEGGDNAAVMPNASPPEEEQAFPVTDGC